MFGTHTLYILHQGTAWNHRSAVGLLDHFSKREGVHLRWEGWKKHLYEKALSHGCPHGGVIFPDGVQRPGHCSFSEDAAAVSCSFPKPYRLPVMLWDYISLLTSLLSVGFFNPWNKLLVFTLRLQTYESAGNCHDGQLAVGFRIG